MLYNRSTRITGGLLGALSILTARRSAADSTVDLGTIMPLGDSITYGQNIYSYTPGAWRDPFYVQMTAAGYRFQFVGTQTGNSDATLQAAGESANEGHSGFTIAPIAGRDGISDNIASWLSQTGTSPNYILLMIGTNDIYTGNLAGADDRLAALIDQISNPVTGLDPKGRLIVSTILPDTASAQTMSDVQSFNAGIIPVVQAAEMAGENVGYANIGPTIDPATDMIDILHPNTAGEQIIAAGWAAAIQSGPTLAATSWAGPPAGGTPTWSAATNWLAGIPESPGVTATFTTVIDNTGTGNTGTGNAAAGSTITLDGNFTVGHLVFNSSSGYTIAPGTGGTLTIEDTGPIATGLPDVTVLAGSHTIAVPLSLAHGVTFNIASGSSLTVSAPISGNGDVSFTGPGNVLLTSSESYSGATNISAGTLTLGTGGRLPPGTDVTVATGARFVNATSAGTGAIQLDSLNLAGTPGNWTAAVDIGPGAVDISHGLLATVTDQVREGYDLPAGGNWNGPGGITSSAAAADTSHLTAIGVILNNAGGTAIYNADSPFDGVTPGLNDILVRDTYVGDANLDGTVDGSDYSLIDNGFISNGTLTGWYNGDFNYDGTIDGSDYALIDNAYNNQDQPSTTTDLVASATVQTAAPAAVPEPAGLAILIATTTPAVRRRHRRHRIRPA